MVRATRYVTERLQVLIQAVCFCPSGESARTLFKSSESNPTLINKQTSPHAQCLTVPLRGPIPLATSVCELIFFHFCVTTVYNPRWMPERNETSERIACSCSPSTRCKQRSFQWWEQRHNVIYLASLPPMSAGVREVHGVSQHHSRSDASA